MAIFKKQYTIGDVMNIDSGRQERAAGCTVSLVKTYHELASEGVIEKFKSKVLGKAVVKKYYITFKFEVSSDKGHKHIVFIRVAPDFDLTQWNSNKVKIYCDCQDFKYRSAYLLGQHDALFLNSKISSALGPAVSDAPRGKHATSLLCKHAYAALNYLVSNYSSIMKTV